MPKLYAHIENGAITYKGALPKNWRNVSGLNLSGDQDRDFLQSIGWCPLTVVEADLGPDEEVDGEDVDIEYTEDGKPGFVTITILKRTLTPEEIKERDFMTWQQAMIKTDDAMPRYVEDIYDALANKKAVAKYTRDLIDAKKALRAKRPV